MIKAIPTYVINLPSRIDRRTHIEKEFNNRDEFDVRIVPAIRHEVGGVGLWDTMKKIISDASKMGLDYVLICEDDHQFSSLYNRENFEKCIEEAIEKNADVLCGGPSWFEDAIFASDNLFWVSRFSGTQFIIIFNRLYNKILSAGFTEDDSSDYKISDLASNKYFVHPFISTQKEFGYSDATSINHGSNRVEELFATTEKNADILKNIYSFYRNAKQDANYHLEVEFEAITIPTYIINLPERTERLAHIINQFNGRTEFETSIIEAYKHKIGAVGLWQSIRKVVQLAIDNDDDVIIICEDDHEFTAEYSKEFLLKNIIEAHEQGCEYLNCGSAKFDFVIPVSPDRYWVNTCLSTQFIVLYSNFFQKILDEPFDDTVVADWKLSEMTSHKMILNPFISTQRNFGYSDITAIHNEQENLWTNLFTISKSRLKTLSTAVDEHGILVNKILKN